MRALRFEHESELPVPAERVWAYHLSPGALVRLSPPFPPTKVTDPGDGVAEGSVVVLRLGFWPFTRFWRALHTTVEAPRAFVDIALDGPFRFWVHQHVFEPLSASSSRLRDVVHFLPGGHLPVSMAGPVARIALWLLFRWRHRRTRLDLTRDSGCEVPRHPAVALL